MLKAQVGYSTNMDSFTAGVETATNAVNKINNTKLGFLYTSEVNDIKEVIKGIRSIRYPINWLYK